MWFHIASAFVLIAAVICIRAYSILPDYKHSRNLNRVSKTCKLAVFLGSGGHTSEMLALVSSLDFDRYTPRTYILSEGDTLSERKAIALEASKVANTTTENSNTNTLPYTILVIPRARKVHQSLMTTPSTAFFSLLQCLYHITIKSIYGRNQHNAGYYFADVLLLNGPGTCLVLCVAVYFNKFIHLSAPKVIYVESFARVKTLSLSGKLLRPLVDKFIVQWPQLLKDNGRGECRGWLI
ncbi:glycosyltransferase family 1 protein [Rhodocollybia butyracea]|uniref:UDP-N-acetylglucosamine transferase subunit ALG14 n=1 Tax=Rhodocollybia butyracea TaxID=206335 RepID=A0A9P5PQY7_9AGAR|nr:glycosyltransferase family 1 protein [Rhodocollybia butyracea]